MKHIFLPKSPISPLSGSFLTNQKVSEFNDLVEKSQSFFNPIYIDQQKLFHVVPTDSETDPQAYRQLLTQYLKVIVEKKDLYLFIEKTIEIPQILKCSLFHKLFSDLNFEKVENDSIDEDYVNTTRKQIHLDSIRTVPLDCSFLFSLPKMLNLLENVLFSWSMQHQNIGYFQGLNEICSVLVVEHISNALGIIDKSVELQFKIKPFLEEEDEQEEEEEQNQDNKIENNNQNNNNNNNQSSKKFNNEFVLNQIEKDVLNCLHCLTNDLLSIKKIGTNGKNKMDCAHYAVDLVECLRNVLENEQLFHNIDAKTDGHCCGYCVLLLFDEQYDLNLFAFRWLHTLQLPSHTSDETMSLWLNGVTWPRIDKLPPIAHCFVYVCAALLIELHSKLKPMCFEESIKFLTNLRRIPSAKQLIEKANVIRKRTSL